MKTTKILYWVFTGLLAALMLFSGIPDLLVVPEAVEMFDHLGYPAYLLPFLGVAKILGAIAILVPAFPRLKEWAYAGFVFDLLGASYSAFSVGDPADHWLFPFIGIALVFLSYFFYHKKRKLAGKHSVTA